ncbi:hypothetical protein M409DRAFT_29167 [Zasmidium cellare ATCC 36951]|uniref:NAD(P)-binding protein n=1 Tax=Zasmidium cellare ATCC 36951 TaxID=1080233 RepID=A0A6A6C0B3_ZASCE|nr:uncharacterized protein M409DRAFT_29167 [Zasmidium cellare ATCC 36951]KAF2160313.1 hypothetical protein M409DRAFT_29167 [Zasmidium cellare ATCC 36951]
MQPPLPSFTAEWHNTSYASISPSRPELSVAGKTIVITGGGNGIGARMVRSFAEAGAARIAITARREQNLKDVKAKTEAAFPKTKVDYYVGDVVNEADVKAATAGVGKWDVLVLNAGYLSKREAIAKADFGEWWRGFEVNLKGTFLVLQAFTPTAKEGAAVIGMSSGVVTFSSEMAQTASSYAASKIALNKVMEVFAAEHPQLNVKVFHPGVIETEMLAKSELSGLPIDDISLPADFAVWFASKEADFIKGRFVSCNWDVDELKKKAAQFEQNPLLLTSNILGWYPGQI